MPMTAPLTRMPIGTPYGTGTPRRWSMRSRPNSSSMAMNTASDHSAMRTGVCTQRVRSAQKREMLAAPRLAGPGTRISTSGPARQDRLAGGPLADGVAAPLVQRDVGAGLAVDVRSRVGVPVDLAGVRDGGVVALREVDERGLGLVAVAAVAGAREQGALERPRVERRPGSSGCRSPMWPGSSTAGWRWSTAGRCCPRRSTPRRRPTCPARPGWAGHWDRRRAPTAAGRRAGPACRSR